MNSETSRKSSFDGGGPFRDFVLATTSINVGLPSYFGHSSHPHDACAAGPVQSPGQGGGTPHGAPDGSMHASRRATPCGAPRGGDFGPRVALSRPSSGRVSELLAAGRIAGGRSPGASRCPGSEPEQQAPHPAPLKRRLARASLRERGCCGFNSYRMKSQVPRRQPRP
jgi:hypothetical protein